MLIRSLVIAVALVTCAIPPRILGAASAVWSLETIDCPLRGRTLTLTIYHPVGTPKGTIFMGSGDVGWVGLGVTMSAFLADRGYRVVGVNTRQYLSVFTIGKQHLTVDDIPRDFAAIRTLLESRHLMSRPTIFSGVSEGAAIAVLAASSKENHAWVDGVVTMGVPMVAELAWRWKDAVTWFTKADANEPSFSALDFVARVSPLPLVMIQSTRDEYVSAADYRKFEATAQSPRKLVLIDASNHRFTDRQEQLRIEMLSALSWIKASGPGRGKVSDK